MIKCGIYSLITVMLISGKVYAYEIGKVNLHFKANLIDRTCNITSGKDITFDFGDIPTTAFTSVGVGQAVPNVPVQTETITLDCQNITAQHAVSARLIANRYSDNMIVSSNDHVGFQVANKDSQVIKPNDSNSLIPISVVNSKASFIIQSWPVSVTGVLPNPGQIEASGHIQIEYD